MEAPIDQNSVKTVIGVSSVDSTTPIAVSVNPSTGAVIVELA